MAGRHLDIYLDIYIYIPVLAWTGKWGQLAVCFAMSLILSVILFGIKKYKKQEEAYSTICKTSRGPLWNNEREREREEKRREEKKQHKKVLFLLFSSLLFSLSLSRCSTMDLY